MTAMLDAGDGKPFHITLFSDFGARDKTEESVTLEDLAVRIRKTSRAEKAVLPWLKLARFGNRRTEKNSLRNDANVLAITGIEADYDGETMSVEDAVEKLTKAGIRCMLYTSPSHTEDSPRWRVICPTSEPLPPTRREAIMGRLNGLFGGIFSSESWTLSQAYYFGSVKNNPSHQVHVIDGWPIDEHDDLDEIWTGKPDTIARPAVNGHHATGVVDEPALLTDITTGASYHAASVRLLGRWARQGVAYMQARARLVAAFEAVPEQARDARWKSRYEDVDRCLEDIYGAEATARDQGKRASFLEDAPPPIDDPGYYASLDDHQMPSNGPVDFEADYGSPHVVPIRPGVRPQPTAELRSLPLIWFADIEPILDAHDFVQGLLLENSSAVVYGASNSGKTFWVTDLSLHVAAALRWNDRRVDMGGVVYCALEGTFGFRNRVAAWKAARELQDYPLPFAAIPVGLNLRAPSDDADALVKAVIAAAEEMKLPVRLVVIDTLSRALAGGNENAPEDMGALVACMDSIREQTKAAVLFIHHSGKDQAKGARGHSLLTAAIDTEIEITVDETGGGSTATVVKQREMRKGDAFSFTLRVVTLGQNRHGESVTTCVVDHGGDHTAGAVPGRRRLTGHDKRALEILADLVATSGQEGYAGVPPDFMSVPEKWWRDRFDDRAMPGAEEPAKRKAFRRASDRLIEGKFVGMANKRVWLPRRGGGDGPNVEG